MAAFDQDRLCMVDPFWLTEGWSMDVTLVWQCLPRSLIAGGYGLEAYRGVDMDSLGRTFSLASTTASWYLEFRAI